MRGALGGPSPAEESSPALMPVEASPHTHHTAQGYAGAQPCTPRGAGPATPLSPAC